MSKTLLESDFLTVNIKSIYNKETSKEASDQEQPTASDGVKKGPAVKDAKINTKIDWSKELEDRLAKNKALDSESQESEFDIRRKFWLEFFTAAFGEECAKILIEIDLLKKDIEVLGFKKQANPLLSFLKNKYVQTELLLTKLINSNTYKVIHNALAKRHIADSEFLKSNDYNIIYCRAWYKITSIAEMEEYLKEQKKVLPPNVNTYESERLDRNKRVFLQVGQKSVKSKNAELNSLDEVRKLLGSMGYTSSNKNTEKPVETTDSSEDKPVLSAESNLEAFCESPAHAFATLQYLSVALGSSEASEALLSGFLSGISSDEIAKASRELGNKLRSFKINEESIPGIVEAITDAVRG